MRLDFQPLSTLKQKLRNRLDVENDVRLVKNLNTVNLACEMIVLSHLVGCYLNTFRVAGNGWGQGLM